MQKSIRLRGSLVATALVCFGALSAQAAPTSCASPLSAPSTSTATQATSYPLTTCVVSGEALGSMGESFIHIHKESGKPDREVRLCCKSCLKKFLKNPAKYLAKLDAPATAPAPTPAAPKADAHSDHAN